MKKISYQITRIKLSKGTIEERGEEIGEGKVPSSVYKSFCNFILGHPQCAMMKQKRMIEAGTHALAVPLPTPKAVMTQLNGV